MKDIRKIIKLDYLSIRPYFTIKNLVIFVGLAFFYSYLAKSPTATFTMPILFALMFSTYPFLVGDEAGIDSLYRVFGIEANHVVYGRYVFGFLLSSFCVVLGMGLFIASALLFKYSIEFHGIENNIFVSYFIINLVVAIQYPLYFKYGYTKAKGLAIIPFMLFAILGFVLSQFKNQLFAMFLAMTKNEFSQFLFFLSLLIVLLLVFFLSITLSTKIYRKRDF